VPERGSLSKGYAKGDAAFRPHTRQRRAADSAFCAHMALSVSGTPRR
jgi:hypothetical protein